MKAVDELFKKRKIDFEKLLSYGFILSGSDYVFTERLAVEGDFVLRVTINTKSAFYEVIDGDFGEEYALSYVENAQGAFVGAVKNAIKKRLFDIIENCTVSEIFSFDRARAIAEYIKRTYKEDLEFLWEKFPTDAIVRNKENGKWYLVLMEVKAEKIGIDSKENIMVFNVRCKKGEAEKLIDGRLIFPAYHMNKRSWITVLLSKEADDETLFSLIDESRKLSVCAK